MNNLQWNKRKRKRDERKQGSFPRGSEFSPSHVTSMANVESINRKSTTVWLLWSLSSAVCRSPKHGLTIELSNSKSIKIYHDEHGRRQVTNQSLLGREALLGIFQNGESVAVEGDPTPFIWGDDEYVFLPFNSWWLASFSTSSGRTESK